MLHLKRFEFDESEQVWDIIKSLTKMEIDIRGQLQYPRWDPILEKWVLDIAYTFRASGEKANNVEITLEGHEEGAAAR